MTKKKNTSWQFKVSTALSIVMLFLILSYFVESFLTIRKVKPVTVAIERITETSASRIPEQPE